MQIDTENTFSAPLTYNNISIPMNTMSFVVPSNTLTTGQKYFWRVIAVNAIGSTIASNAPFSFTTGTVTPSLTPSEITACNATGNPGDLVVKGIDFVNNGMQYKTFGEDDEWFPFEELEVEMEIENDGSNDVDDISVEWGLWDTKSNRWVIDLDEEDELNLKDGDKETLTATFTIDDDMDVDLEDLSDGNNYKFYVIATGTVDNSTSPKTCASDFEEVSIVIEGDFVIVNNVQIPESLQCGETATITADVWNIGDNDQDEVSVYVENKALNLVEDIMVGDMDAFDNQRISFSFTVPEDAEEKTYSIRFEVLDEHRDVYENDFDEDLSELTLPLTVSGRCTGAVSATSISASLVSGGTAGEDLVVKSVVTNSGSSSATYLISAAEFEGWASSYDVSPQSLVIPAGESGEATYTFEINKDAYGEQSFFIELTAAGNEAIRQEVSVNIKQSEGFLGITGLAIGGNTGLWALGALNVVLVLIIIFVAIRITRRK